MLHANLVGVSPYHPLYATELQKFQFRDPWNGNLIWMAIGNETDAPLPSLPLLILQILRI